MSTFWVAYSYLRCETKKMQNKVVYMTSVIFSWGGSVCLWEGGIFYGEGGVVKIMGGIRFSVLLKIPPKVFACGAPKIQ